MSVKRAVLALSMTMMMLAGVGCQDMGMSGSSMTAPAGRAIVITGGNGGGTAVFLPGPDKDHVLLMDTAGAKMCTQCESDAIKFFQTGQIDPKCSVCGATRTPVTYIPSSTGHN